MSAFSPQSWAQSILAIRAFFLRTPSAAARTNTLDVEGAPHVLVYQRHIDFECFHIALNFSTKLQFTALPRAGVVKISTHMDRLEDVEEQLALRANEGVVIELGGRLEPMS